ncbi:MAG: hypothetical protein R3Y23_02845 [Bacillota bacterium]
MAIFVLENDRLKLSVNSVGCCLDGIVDKNTGEQLMWQGDNECFPEHDLCLFPFVARLNNGSFTHKGRSYNLPIHGINPYEDFKLVRITADSVTLGLTHTQETLKMYPFVWKFFATFALKDNEVNVIYHIENSNDEPMYFGIGGHPAFYVDSQPTAEGCEIEGNTVDFGEEASLTRITCDEQGFYPTGESYYGIMRTLPLNKSLFNQDAIILRNATGSVTLIRNSGAKIKVSSKSDFMAMWTNKTQGNYICFEPWWSLPDYVGAPTELKDKKTIKSLPAGGSDDYSYSITIL